jgi:hypothetical protein
MKNKSRSLLLTRLFFGVFVIVVGAARAQPQQPTPPIFPRQDILTTQMIFPPQGLFTRLLEIKYTSELYASIAIKQGDKDSAMAIYNTLRWKIDGLVYQLSADMIATNSPRKFILLNNWCLKETEVLNKITNPVLDKANMKRSGKDAKVSIQQYVIALQEIDAFYRSNIIIQLQATNPNNSNASSRPKTLNLTTNVFYLLKDSYTIMKGISDIKTQKTMALVELLDHTRLMSPVEVGKMGK